MIEILALPVFFLVVYSIFMGGLSLIVIGLAAAEKCRIYLTTVYKVLPVIVIEGGIEVFSTKHHQRGAAFGIIVMVPEEAEDMDEILSHELIHAKQAWRHLIIFEDIMSRISKKHLIKAEWEAYKNDLTGHTDDEIVELLYEMYNLDMEYDDIYKVVNEV